MKNLQICSTWNIYLEFEHEIKVLAQITCKNPFKTNIYKEHRELFRKGLYKGIFCISKIDEM